MRMGKNADSKREKQEMRMVWRDFFQTQIYFFIYNVVHVHLKLENNARE